MYICRIFIGCVCGTMNHGETNVKVAEWMELDWGVVKCEILWWLYWCSIIKGIFLNTCMNP